MILTPTYHVFEMFKGHQDATRLPSVLQSDDYAFENDTIPMISASASRNDAGEVLITVCNLNPNEPAELGCNLQGTAAQKVTGRVLTAGTMNAINTFASPETVHPVPFNDAVLDGDDLKIALPPKSVVALTLA